MQFVHKIIANKLITLHLAVYVYKYLNGTLLNIILMVIKNTIYICRRVHRSIYTSL